MPFPWIISVFMIIFLILMMSMLFGMSSLNFFFTKPVKVKNLFMWLW